MDDESGESMEPMEEVPLIQLYGFSLISIVFVLLQGHYERVVSCY